VRDKLIIIVFIIFSSIRLSHSESSRFYIFNVGQGQWAIWSINHACLHFDMGGEYAPLARIESLCRGKDNWLYLSHSDFDHIRYLPWARQKLKNFCLYKLPREDIKSPKKLYFFNNTPLCPDIDSPNKHYVTEIEFLTNSKNMASNDLSRIYVLKSRHGNLLLPGDSTKKSEKIWAPQIAKYNIRYFILGHHGSRTSTSPWLLRHMPNLISSFASARKRRYGHPHNSVVARIAKTKTPLVKTEAWGNIIIDF
jgi:competence protein ComEC